MLDTLEYHRDELSADTYRFLQIHLTAVGHYEKQKKAEKVVKHMNSFTLLLDQHKESGLITEEVYNKLKS
ncbi:FIMAH domain-containing protein [Lentibacillus daqui]|uniref:FIMAH domain-containing protein n=1 Tax=Lentibacillus daqui TaxID=2911514 RepID=UPI0022B2170D|nr:hypothetical protein [Lentibacillus daqui]